MIGVSTHELERRIMDRLRWIRKYREEAKTCRQLANHHNEWLKAERAELRRRAAEGEAGDAE